MLHCNDALLTMMSEVGQLKSSQDDDSIELKKIKIFDSKDWRNSGRFESAIETERTFG